MLKKVSAALLALGLVIAIASPVLAYLYRAPITILEANGTAYTMLPVSVTSNNKYMSTDGFMTATARDTRVSNLGGTAYAHMVADAVTMTATALPAHGQVNLYYSTGETAADYDIIPGYGGSITLKDSAALEGTNNFEFEFGTGYIDTTAPLIGQNLISKTSAYTTYISAASEITTKIYGAPATENLIPNAVGDYTNITNAFPFVDHYLNIDDAVGAPDDSTTTVYTSSVAQLKDAYNLPNTAIGVNDYITSVTVYFRALRASAGSFAQPFLRLGAVETTGTEVNLTAVWATYSEVLARPGGGSWTVADLNSLQVAVGLRDASSNNTYLTQVYVVVTYSPATAISIATPVASGSHTVKITADGVNIKTFIDTVEADSDALAGASIPDNANNWVLMSNAMPYCSYYKHTVGGVLVAHYAPNDIIHGTAYSTGTVTVTNGDATVTGAGGAAWTDAMDGGLFVSADGVQYVISSVTSGTTLELTAVYGGGTLGGQTYNMYVRLPDRQGADQDGRITWGSNPAGVTATLGGMVSGSQAAPGLSTTDDTPRDLMSEVPVSDWNIDPAIGTTLATNPLRPIVQILSDNTPMTETDGWRLLGGAFILMVFAMAAKFLRGHYLLVGISTGAAIGACVAMTIFPLIFLIGVIVCVLAGIVAERMQSV